MEKPLSIMEVETAINIAIIAITPYSAGVNKRASTNPTKKAIPELAMLSIKLHPTPRTVLCLNVSDKSSNLTLLSPQTDKDYPQYFSTLL